MKKIILISIIFIGMNNFCLAEEEEEILPPSKVEETKKNEVIDLAKEEIKPKSKKMGLTIGGTFGSKKISEGLLGPSRPGNGGNIFLDRTYKYAKLSLNVGYDHYDNKYWSGDYREIINDIPITFGTGLGVDFTRISSLNTSTVGFRFYFICEFGVLFRDEKNIYSADFSGYKYPNEKTSFYVLDMGYSASLVFYRTINLEANFKIRNVFGGAQANIGLGYNF